jgi:hypothetical protein
MKTFSLGGGGDAISLSIWICVSPYRFWTVGRILLMFGIKSLSTCRWTVEMNFLYSNIGSLHRGRKTQNGDFPKDGADDYN